MSDSTLARIRKKLGFSAEEIAAAGGWSRRNFKQLESADELDVEDALKLNDLYGVDVASMLESGQTPGANLPVAALLKGNADILTADTRFAMTEAMSIARDVRTVEEILDFEYTQDVTSFREDLNLAHPRDGHVQEMALQVRQRLDLRGPIPSLIDDVIEKLGILVFAHRLNDQVIDAFSTWSQETGPVIVINNDSPRTSGPLGLRATLAHELCHLLFDRLKMRKIHAFCEIERPSEGQFREFEKREQVEQRARAFQVELLAPQHELVLAQKQLSKLPAESQLARLCETWGLGPVAISWQLRNGGGRDLTEVSTVCRSYNAFREWDAIRQLAVPISIPPMRRGKLLNLVKRAVRKDALSVSWARELLRMSVKDFDAESSRWTS